MVEFQFLEDRQMYIANKRENPIWGMTKKNVSIIILWKYTLVRNNTSLLINKQTCDLEKSSLAVGKMQWASSPVNT